MINISAAGEGFSRSEITNSYLINSKGNVADHMTKLSPNTALHQLLTRHVVDHKVLQYVVNPATHKENMTKDEPNISHFKST
jgi:hypothetical protein